MTMVDGDDAYLFHDGSLWFFFGCIPIHSLVAQPIDLTVLGVDTRSMLNVWWVWTVTKKAASPFFRVTGLWLKKWPSHLYKWWVKFLMRKQWK